MTSPTFVWNELNTRDPAAAKKFYAALFGWTFRDHSMGPMGTYNLIDIDGQEKGGIMPMQGPQFDGVPPHWMTYVGVENIDASADKVKELGGAVHVPPTDIPGTGRFAVIADPTGAVLALFQPKA